MKVSKWMLSEVPICAPNDTLAEAAEVMLRRDCGSVPAIDEEGKVLGILTDRDICMCGLIEGQPLDRLPVSLAMSKELWTCTPDDELDTVFELMKHHKVSRLPVVDEDQKLVGLVRLGDLAQAATKAPGKETMAEFARFVEELESRRLGKNVELETA